MGSISSAVQVTAGALAAAAARVGRQAASNPKPSTAPPPPPPPPRTSPVPGNPGSPHLPAGLPSNLRLPDFLRGPGPGPDFGYSRGGSDLTSSAPLRMIMVGRAGSSRPLDWWSTFTTRFLSPFVPLLGWLFGRRPR